MPNEQLYFPGQPHSFQGFSRLSIPLIIFQTFQGLENFAFKFHDFPNFSRICMYEAAHRSSLHSALGHCDIYHTWPLLTDTNTLTDFETHLIQLLKTFLNSYHQKL